MDNNKHLLLKNIAHLPNIALKKKLFIFVDEYYQINLLTYEKDSCFMGINHFLFFL